METQKFKQTEIGKIPEDWEAKQLSEVSKFKYGLGESAKEKGEFVYIRITDINQNGSLIKSNLAFIDKEKVKEDCILKRGDVLVARTGATFGKTYFFNEDFKATFGGFLIKFLLDNKLIDNNFFFQFTRGKNYWDQANNLVNGGAQPQFNANVVSKLIVPIPPLHEQQAIASILSSLDEKIELNNKMNQTLEAIGQAIFKKWFIDFEFPDENGKPYKSNGGKMIESELGMIPEGWKIEKLGETGIFKNGINYLRDEIGDTDFFIANVRNIANNKLLLKNSLDKISIDFKKAQDYLLKEKDILIARSASPGEVSLVLGDKEKIIYSGFSIRYRLNNPSDYLYLFLVLQGLKEKLINFSNGTTMQSVNQETLKNMEFVLPSESILKKFNLIIEKIINQTLNNLNQNQSLSQIRDSLLPKLMSGEIRVPLGEKI